MLAAEMATVDAIRYDASGPSLKVLNQLLLPLEHVYEDVFDVPGGWAQIRDMKVRGAPAIAIVGALTLAVDLRRKQKNGEFMTPQDVVGFTTRALNHLRTSRPTAVNLFNMADALTAVAEATASAPNATADTVVDAVVAQAEAMLADDVSANRAIGEHGSEAIIGAAAGNGQLRVLTHCNAGALATAGYGTAVGVIRALHSKGRLDRAYCTETRPYNQGARLTAYELVYEGIPATLVTDSMASFLMKQHGISAVVVGADRVVANGDTANKIGTYQLAIACKYHGIPFFVASPTTTIDMKLRRGDQIHIEERPAHELTHVQGIQIAAPGIGVWNPSFDVTPAELITGIITEKGVVYKAEGAAEFDMQAFLEAHP